MVKGLAGKVRQRLWLSDTGCKYTRLRQPALFYNITKFCMFIGHGRSGSTLVGVLLNAHPEVVLSNELDVLSFLDRKCDNLFNLIYRTAAHQARRGQKGGGGYSYVVHGQWQGRHRQLRVIGDRKAGATAMHLFRAPTLLNDLRKLIGRPLVFISVVRNPFDTLTTTLRYTTRQPNETMESHLEREIEYYFQRAEAISAVAEAESVKFLRHNDLIEDPKGVLSDLCESLEVGADSAYLDSCAAIIQKKPHLTRKQVEWPARLIDAVERRLDDVQWLRHFKYM